MVCAPVRRDNPRTLASSVWISFAFTIFNCTYHRTNRYGLSAHRTASDPGTIQYTIWLLSDEVNMGTGYGGKTRRKAGGVAEGSGEKEARLADKRVGI